MVFLYTYYTNFGTCIVLGIVPNGCKLFFDKSVSSAYTTISVIICTSYLYIWHGRSVLHVLYTFVGICHTSSDVEDGNIYLIKLVNM